MTPDLTNELKELTQETGRQIGIFVNRRGAITHVILGDHKRIMLPDLQRFRVGKGRLRGLRYIHTHVSPESLNQEDLGDLLFLRLDCLVLIQSSLDANHPESLTLASIHPAAFNPGKSKRERMMRRTHFLIENFSDASRMPHFETFVGEIENQLSLFRSKSQHAGKKETALLVHVVSNEDVFADELLDEMKLLCKSVGLEIADIVIQKQANMQPAFLIGRGKLSDVIVQAICQSADILLFTKELTPNQVRNLAKVTDLKIVDRTQLILDVFAKRATTKDGKIEVELAQLRYRLPRLSSKAGALSRLMGGVGGRGPGESKLEIDRRRVRERMHRLQKQGKQLAVNREKTRSLRKKNRLPIIATVGYTNVGKSTLFNQLTGSKVAVENAAFKTLEPTSRRLWLPPGLNTVLLDTVGFIRDLPEELLPAFKATLEEIGNADLIVHVLDAGHEDLHYQYENVLSILEEMELGDIPRLDVLNKVDLIAPLEAKILAKQLNAVSVSALQRETLKDLLEVLGERLMPDFSHQKVGP